MKTSIIAFHTYLRATCCALACLATLSVAHSQETFTLTADDTGWYSSAGNHTQNNENYIAGHSSISGLLNNFLAFDLSSINSPITEATLRLLNPGPPNFGDNNGYISPDPTETYEVFDVTTDVDELLAGDGGLAAFNDLGSGVSFGSVVVTRADNGRIVEIDLNAAAIAALDNADGLFAFGGTVTTVGQDVVTEAVFAFSNDAETRLVELRITTIPEPSAVLLAGLAISAVGFRRP